MPNIAYGVSIGSISQSVIRTGDDSIAAEVTLPVGQAVTAWVKTDANTAAMRTELRSYLRSLPPMERLAAMRANVDEVTASAILSAPPHLSGLSDEQHAAFREARLRLRHPEKLASLDAATAATKLVARTLDAARTSTRERYLPLLPAAEVEVKPLAPAWVP